MMKKIVAISGTHGTGKTFLAYNLCIFLKKLGYNAVVMNELARESPFAINRDAGDVTQIWLLCRQITKELELMSKYDIVIVDRSVIDAYCYGMVMSNYLDTNDWIFSYLINYLVEHVKKFYYKFFLLDPDYFNYNLEDGVRDTDPTFRISVHNMLLDVLGNHNINYKLVRNDAEIYKYFSDNTAISS